VRSACGGLWLIEKGRDLVAQDLQLFLAQAVEVADFFFQGEALIRETCFLPAQLVAFFREGIELIFGRRGGQLFGQAIDLLAQLGDFILLAIDGVLLGRLDVAQALDFFLEALELLAHLWCAGRRRCDGRRRRDGLGSPGDWRLEHLRWGWLWGWL